jgi:hypothetical protein
VVGCCEHGNKHLGSIEDRHFLSNIAVITFSRTFFHGLHFTLLHAYDVGIVIYE